MNELNIEVTPFMAYLISRQAERSRRDIEEAFDERTIKKWAGVFQEPILGAGQDSVVVPHPREDDKVFGLWFRSLSQYTVTPNQAAFVYHWHFILSSLFPFNFPEVYTAVGAEPGERVLRGTIRRRLDLSRLKPTYPFGQQLIQFMGQLPLVHEIEGNIGVDRNDRGQYFYDLVEPIRANDIKKPHIGADNLVAYSRDIYGYNNPVKSDFDELVRKVNPSLELLESLGYL